MKPILTDSSKKCTTGASLQVFTKDGGPLTKHIKVEDGQLVKDASQCRMSSGTVETVDFDSMASLAALLTRLNTNQAIALSTTSYRDVSSNGPKRVVRHSSLPSNPTAISRTKDYLKFQDGQPALMLLDRDSSDDELMTSTRALSVLEEFIPGFKDLAVLVTHSSSSFISGVDGVEISGEGNHHTYVVVANGADIPRYAKAFEGYLWLKGYGRPFITRSGIFLLRTVFDLAVFSPERLVFEAAATLDSGLVQKRPEPWFREGEALDTTLLPDLTDEQLGLVRQLKVECRAVHADEAARVRFQYLSVERAKLVQGGMDEKSAARIVADRLSGQLDDLDLLFFDHMNGVPITVGEARNRRTEFIGKTLADPLEPDYTGEPGSIVKGKAKCLEKPDGEMFIKSFAHGDTRYQLTGELLDKFDVITLTPEEQVESDVCRKKNRERADELAKRAIEKAKFSDPSAMEVERREYQKRENAAIGEGVNQVARAEIVTLDVAVGRFVFLSEGSRVADIFNPHFDLAFSDWAATYAASKMMVLQPEKIAAGGRVVKDDDKAVSVSVIWKASPERKTVVCRTFKAGGALMLNDPQGRRALNTWKPYDRTLEVKDLNAAELSLFLDHIDFLFREDASRFLDWLAHIEQRPGELPHTAWLHIASNFGMGRNWLAAVLSRVWAGNVAANLDLPRLLNDGFTGQLSRKVLAIVDEIREGGRDSQWQHAEKLKSLITEETQLINPKYGRQTIESNACRWLMFSNHLSAIPMETGDRRIEVVSIDAKPRSPAYYEKLYLALKSPEFIAAIAAYLGQRAIEHFKPGAHAVNTEAKTAATKASQSPMAELVELVVMHWPSDLITASDLFAVLTNGERNSGTGSLNASHRRTLEQFGVVPFGGPVKLDRDSVRLQILRNKSRWLDAELSDVKAEVARANVRGLNDPLKFLMETAAKNEEAARERQKR